MIRLVVNDTSRELDVPEDTPLLWALRDGLELTGTKYGCGMGLCGACTVHVDGEALPACVTPVGQVAGKRVTTIEGLSAERAHPVQQAWIREQVPQCGFCQSGQIMVAAALLAKNPAPSEAEIEQALNGVICRCGTYQRVRAAVRRASQRLKQEA